MSTNNSAGSHNFIQTLDKFDYQHRRLAFGDKWGGWRFRMKTYMDACNELQPDTIVLLTDADDVLVVRRYDVELLARFMSFGKDIVVSAELSCIWNCMPVTEYWKLQQQQQSATAFKYANGGGQMGRAGAIANMWKWALDEGYEDDQFALGNYINTYPDSVALDHEHKIFYVVPPPIANRTPTYTFEGNEIILISSEHDIVAPTSSPYFLHFAGNFIQTGISRTVFMHSHPNLDTYDTVASGVLGKHVAISQPIHPVSLFIGQAIIWSLVIMFALLFVVYCVLYYKRRRKSPNQNE